MVITPAPICSIRTCTTPATDLFHFRWQGRTVENAYCHPCYLQARTNFEAVDGWDDGH